MYFVIFVFICLFFVFILRPLLTLFFLRFFYYSLFFIFLLLYCQHLLFIYYFIINFYIIKTQMSTTTYQHHVFWFIYDNLHDANSFKPIELRLL